MAVTRWPVLGGSLVAAGIIILLIVALGCALASSAVNAALAAGGV